MTLEYSMKLNENNLKGSKVSMNKFNPGTKTQEIDKKGFSMKISKI